MHMSRPWVLRRRCGITETSNHIALDAWMGSYLAEWKAFAKD